MTFASRSARIVALALLVALAGCASAPAPVMSRTDSPLITVPKAPAYGGAPGPVAGANGGPAADAQSAPSGPARPEPYLRPGSGRMINENAARAPAPDYSGAGEATFNFEGESVHAVVKAILGDLLQQNYVIAPGVQGTVTLATPRPVDAAQALSLLEMVLAWNNARLIWADGRYNVVPSDQALMGAVPRVGSPANARGYEVRAVPLRYIAANEMSEILKPYARPNAIVQIDKQRNLIVLAGTRAELQNYLRTVEIFDVDWLAGMSVGVYPLQSAEAVKVVSDLEKVFGEGAKTPVAGMFRFMPLEGQNAVMVITPQASYLRQVEDWIARMDAGGEGARLFVYEVKYVKATDLAEQLSSVYGNASASTGQDNGNDGQVMPGLDPVEVRTDQMPPAGGPIAPATPPPAGPSGGDTLSIAGGEVGISAVEESNSLLVRASPSQWESIRRAIERLDAMPVQVHIEAQVVEVKLTGELSYGVSWFFGNDVPNTEANPLRPISESTGDWYNFASHVAGAGNGFTWVGPSAAAILNTLDSVSDLRVLSAPSVLVRNNVEANFNSGQQIPVASTIINNGSNTNTDNAYSQVQFRQTGISLTVKPRVSADGMVFMEITQDVSSPSATGPVVAGNVSVDNNKLHTEVAVQDGETVMLAGLIKTENSKGSNGFPGLSRLPVIGALFGQQNRSANRNEVLVLITPRVVRDPAEARQLTDEYGQRFRALEPLRKGKVTH